MKKPPIQELLGRFDSKGDLVKELMSTLRPKSESKDDFVKRMTKVSSKKLLRLHRVETELKERFGSREDLVDAICKLKFKGSVDDNFRQKLLTSNSARLMDLHRQLS